MTDHKHKEISWGIWAILLLTGAYHSRGLFSTIMFIMAFVNWALMMWHGWMVDREKTK